MTCECRIALASAATQGVWMCPECDVIEKVDEDGCCFSCGSQPSHVHIVKCAKCISDQQTPPSLLDCASSLLEACKAMRSHNDTCQFMIFDTGSFPCNCGYALAQSAIRQCEGLEPIKPTIDECVFHRCLKHRDIPQLNSAENGSECGACIQAELKEALQCLSVLGIATIRINKMTEFTSNGKTDLEHTDSEIGQLRAERDEQSARADDNFASVERIKAKYSTLATAARHMLDKINSQGFWDEGCFYYQRHSAPELQNPIEALTKALGLESDQPKTRRLHVFVGRMKKCKSCGLPRTSPQHMVPHE